METEDKIVEAYWFQKIFLTTYLAIVYLKPVSLY